MAHFTEVQNGRCDTKSASCCVLAEVHIGPYVVSVTCKPLANTPIDLHPSAPGRFLTHPPAMDTPMALAATLVKRNRGAALLM